MATFDDFAAAAKMRDLMIRAVDGEIERARPRYRYATVELIDEPSNKAMVIYAGESASVPVKMGSIIPSMIGQTVRIDGLPGDRYIADVLGVAKVADTVTVQPPTALTLSTSVDFTYPQVTASWVAPDDPSVIAYEVRYRPLPAISDWQFNRTQELSLRVYPLAKNTQYEFQVRALTLYNVSEPADATVTTSHDTTAPVAPIGVTAVGGAGAVEVKWLANTEPDVANGAGQYRVQLATTSAFTTIIKDQRWGGTQASYLGLNSATTYWARVYAIDADGNQSVASASVSATTTTEVLTDGVPPTSSPAVTVLGGVGFLVARWADIGNPDITTYSVYVSTTSGFTPSSGSLYATTSIPEQFIKKMPSGAALVQGVTYYVRVIASDPDGAAAAGLQGSGQLEKVNTPDITVGAITAASGIILNLSVDTLISGSFTGQTMTVGATGTIKSSNWVANTAGWKLSCDSSGAGQLDVNVGTFHNVTVTGVIHANTGSFDGGITSGADISVTNNGKVRSADWTAGVDGWAIYTDGSGIGRLDVNTGTFRNVTVTGAVTATSGSFTGSIHAASGTFDGSVTIGGFGDLRSANYVAGVSGCIINSSVAEFNNVTIRGILAAATFDSNDFVFRNTSPNGKALRIHYDGFSTHLQIGASADGTGGIRWDHGLAQFFCETGGNAPNWNFPNGIGADGTNYGLLNVYGICNGQLDTQSGDFGVKGLRTTAVDSFKAGVAFHVVGAASAAIFQWWPGLGSFQAVNAVDSGYVPITASSFVTVSSSRFKDDIKPLSATMTMVRKHQPVSYKEIGSNPTDPRRLSLVAEDLLVDFPEMIQVGPDGPEGIHTMGAVAVLWRAVQELDARLVAAEARPTRP